MAIVTASAHWSRPRALESVCGDEVVVTAADSRAVFALIDGLGHGPEAHRVAEQSRRTLLRESSRSPAPMLACCHEALRGTRGAAVGVLQINEAGQGCFAGVGNIAVTARSRTPISVISHAGIVGQRMRKIQEYPFSVEAGDLICMFSDGMPSSFDLALSDKTPFSEAPRRLVETYGRAHDDVTVLLIAVTTSATAFDSTQAQALSWPALT